MKGTLEMNKTAENKSNYKITLIIAAIYIATLIAVYFGNQPLMVLFGMLYIVTTALFGLVAIYIAHITSKFTIINNIFHGNIDSFRSFSDQDKSIDDTMEEVRLYNQVRFAIEDVLITLKDGAEHIRNLQKSINNEMGFKNMTFKRAIFRFLNISIGLISIINEHTVFFIVWLMSFLLVYVLRKIINDFVREYDACKDNSKKFLLESDYRLFYENEELELA